MKDQAIWKIETMQYERVMVSHYTYEKTDKTYNTREKGEALLQGFGLDIIEGNDGNFASFSVGIVEWPDGKLELIPIDLIRFIEPHKGGDGL